MRHAASTSVACIILATKVIKTFHQELAELCKVLIFWEGQKILRNLHHRFDWHYIGQIYGGDYGGWSSQNIWTLCLITWYYVLFISCISLPYCIKGKAELETWNVKSWLKFLRLPKSEWVSKGQLISEWNFGVFESPQKPTIF